MRAKAKQFVFLTKVDPFKALLVAWPISLVVQTAIDLALSSWGRGGMMYSPWQTCRALFTWLTGGNPLSVEFLNGQADIGLASLGLAGCLLIFEPLFWAGLTVIIVRYTIRSRNMAD